MARKKTFRQKKELTDEELIEIYNPVSKSTGKTYKKAVGFRVRDNESVTLLRWIEHQTNFSESVRQLIERHLIESGEITDLSRPRDLDELFEERFNENAVSKGVAPSMIEEKKVAEVIEQPSVNVTPDTPAQEDDSPTGAEAVETTVETVEAEETSNGESVEEEDYNDMADAWA
jgi:hypothetical protein